MNLDAVAIRVLGALVEKERTTPEYYPLSLNALVSACNQKTNRDPVMSLEEAEVMRALERLRGAGVALQSADGGRVTKYAHNLIGKLHVDLAEVALLGELLLRGPQTAGELRARAERMYHFDDISDVEAALLRLMEGTPPLVARLSRQPGHKESRYAQLLGAQADGPPLSASPVVSAAVAEPGPDGDRVARLEAEVVELRAEVAALWKELRSLTMQPE